MSFMLHWTQKTPPSRAVFTSGTIIAIPIWVISRIVYKGPGCERYHFQEIQKLMDREEHSRPCVVLAHHGPGSYVVCFLTTVQGQDLSDKAKLSPLVNHLSIPVEQAHKHGLRAEPSLMPPSLLIALPVVRSNLRVSIRLGTRQRLEIRQRLAYGELERARTLVRAKVAEFKNNHEIIRKKELATIWDRSHASNQGLTGSAPTSTTRPKIPREETPKFHPEPLQKFTFLTPPAMGHNVSWIVKHARTDIASASRYLSSLPHPPASPFRLPSPFYSPLLRASLAFVRRRIIP
ncbi:hypothetical protein C8R44DRAFT_160722 [Mycena epipterygia]|nr:hypothetical protein C8R44DRAFT_160722 [Mycena epipterygia]